MKVANSFISILLCILALMACSAFTNKTLADEVMTQYHNSIKTGNWEQAMNFFSPEFFQQTPRETWLQSLKNIHAKLGDLVSAEQTYWKVQAVTGTSRTGTLFTLRYKLVYSKYEAEEEVILFEPAGNHETKILHYTINSDGFIQ